MEEKYAEAIVSGSMPDQETFTKEEAKCLVQTTIAWAVTQIEHELEEVIHDDVPALVKNCDYKTPEEAIEEIQNDFVEQFGALIAHLTTWIE